VHSTSCTPRPPYTHPVKTIMREVTVGVICMDETRICLLGIYLPWYIIYIIINILYIHTYYNVYVSVGWTRDCGMLRECLAWFRLIFNVLYTYHFTPPPHLPTTHYPYVNRYTIQVHVRIMYSHLAHKHIISYIYIGTPARVHNTSICVTRSYFFITT